MPSRYIIREFAENQYYHVFNRGLEKRSIFVDIGDYKIFKYYIFIYLATPDVILNAYPQLPIKLQNKNLHQELELITYCLMPNHFHFLLKQTSPNAISKFMKQLINAYTRYFNNKYQRSGNLFQGRFKAIRISTDELLLHISRYIHLNPLVANIVKNLKEYPWSSYTSFIETNKDDICKKEVILSHFSKSNTYENFVLDQANYAKTLHQIKHLTIDP